MEKTLSSQATNWREGRRLRALELKERGWKQSEIAEALGVSEGAVSQWMKRAREVWTCERVAVVIRREFGVSYHPAHVSRVVRGLGLSLQKPMRRANQRDEQAIRHWKEERWPELKKGP
jgi:transposase